MLALDHRHNTQQVQTASRNAHTYTHTHTHFLQCYTSSSECVLCNSDQTSTKGLWHTTYTQQNPKPTETHTHTTMKQETLDYMHNTNMHENLQIIWFDFFVWQYKWKLQWDYIQWYQQRRIQCERIILQIYSRMTFSYQLGSFQKTNGLCVNQWIRSGGGSFTTRQNQLYSCETLLLPIWGADYLGARVLAHVLFGQWNVFQPQTPSPNAQIPPTVSDTHSRSPSKKHSHLFTFSSTKSCQWNDHSWCNAGRGRK